MGSILMYEGPDGEAYHHPDKEPDRPHLSRIEDISTSSYVRAIFDKNFSKTLSIGTLEVDVVEGANLPAVDFGGVSDPYCELELSGFFGKSARKQNEWETSLRSTARTHFEPKNLNPKWNTCGLTFPLRRHGAVLKVKVYDHEDVLKDNMLGQLTISVNELIPGNHEGWYSLNDPAETETDPVGLPGSVVASGPAIYLRLRLELSCFGETCSFLWSPPQVHKPLARFEPNLFFSKMFDLKKNVVSKILFAAKAITDAIYWKRGPSYTFSVLSVALMIAQHIIRFWVLFHFTLASWVLGIGYLTRWGRVPLVWPALFASTISENDAEVTDEGECAVESAQPHRPKSPPVLTHKSSRVKLKNHPRRVSAEAKDGERKVFTGLTEITLRKAGRTLGKGKPMAFAQAALVEMMKNEELFAAMLLWRRHNMRMGFKDMDGPVMASCFIVFNLIMVALHLTVELRKIAVAGVFVLFTGALVQNTGLLLPQALKLRKRRKMLEVKWKKMGRTGNKRPEAIRRKKSTTSDLNNILNKIFERVDTDESGSIDIVELMQALPLLGEDDKELLREVFVGLDVDDSGDLDKNEFSKLVSSRGGELAEPLVVAELKYLLLGQGMPLIKVKAKDLKLVLTRRGIRSYFGNKRYRTVLRVLRSPNGIKALSYQRKRSDESFVIPTNDVAFIKAHPKVPQLLVVNLKTNLYVPNTSTLMFEVEIGAVRDALIKALRELLF